MRGACSQGRGIYGPNPSWVTHPATQILQLSLRALVSDLEHSCQLCWSCSWGLRDYASCLAARSTQVMIVVNNVQKLRWPAKSLDLNHNDHLSDPLKSKVGALPLQLNLGELTRVVHQMCVAIPQQYLQIDLYTFYQ